MWFASSRRLLSLSLMVFLVSWVLQMWVCCPSCQVGAIRVLPETAVEFSHRIIMDNNKNKNKEKEDLFKKYFGASRTFGPSNNRTQKGFDETKRRVPSCPDPLHN